MRRDIKQTEDGDIDLTGGDLVFVEPTAQHQRDILLAAPGDFKHAPALGVDSFAYLHDSEPDEYFRAVKQNMERDGMTIYDIYFDKNGDLMIDADYEDDKS